VGKIWTFWEKPFRGETKMKGPSGKDSRSPGRGGSLNHPKQPTSGEFIGQAAHVEDLAKGGQQRKEGKTVGSKKIKV